MCHDVVTMYIRTVKAKGTEYVQLAHDYREPEGGRIRAKVLYSFGRKDRLDLDELRRLIRSISRFLDPEEVAGIQEQIGDDWPFEFLGSRELGGAAFLDGMWKRLGIDGELLREGLRKRGYKQLAVIERVFPDLKHVVDIRPIRHRPPERIRAHVLLCWLAMLLIRVAENESGRTWFQMQKTLDTLQVGIHRTRAGEVWQANNPSDGLRTQPPVTLGVCALFVTTHCLVPAGMTIGHLVKLRSVVRCAQCRCPA
jgi:hypothetical protein